MSADYSGKEKQKGPRRGFQNFIGEGRPFASTVFFKATKTASTRGHDYKLYRKASRNLKN